MSASPICIGAVLGAMSILGSLSAGAQEPAQSQPAASIRLIVRADDMGSCHAANEACIRAYRQGIVRSVEVIVPGPWFLEAARMINENPGLDAGVHLCLTSEWELIKWRPLTHAPTLVDTDGYFFPMTSQRPDFPPNTGFLQAPYRLEEVERELRAQIELARRHIRSVSHLSVHMGTATATPQLRNIVQRLAEEYQLPLECPGARYLGGYAAEDRTGPQKEQRLLSLLENLSPGLWIFVEHPGLDCPEMRAMGHKGYWNVAEDRQAVTDAFISDKVRQVILRRGIQLISYAQANRSSSRRASQ